MSARILVVDDEPAIVHALKTLLAREGYEVVDTGDGEHAVDLLRQETFSLLISDIYMDPVDGLELLAVAREQAPTMPVIMITAYGSVDSAVQAMRQGAFDYITKPFKFNDLIQTVQRGLAYGQAQTAGGGSDILRVRYYYQQLAGDSPAMRQVYQVLESLAPTRQPALIIGAPGTGKTLIAHVIHTHSGRHKANLIEVDCSRGVQELQQRLITEGGLEQARNGSLLLENLHAADERLQKQLLALVYRLRPTGDDAMDNNIRIIATSERDLHAMVQQEAFSEELYYQLAAVSLDLPPLQQRREDLPILIQHFLNRYEDQAQRQITISLAALKAMEAYPWPGNLRELRDAINSAAQACRQQSIQVEDLPPELQAHNGGSAQQTDDDAAEFRWRNLRNFLKAKERQYLEQVLEMTDGDRERAAKVVGISLEEFNTKFDSE